MEPYTTAIAVCQIVSVASGVALIGCIVCDHILDPIYIWWRKK